MSERAHGLEAIMVELRYIREDLKENTDLVRVQNGRLRTAEQDIAVLKDRSNDAKKAGGAAGAAGGFAGGFLAAFVSSLFK